MNKEELLQKAKQDNKNYDERDLMNMKNAGAVSAAVGAALCMIINLVCILVGGIDQLVGMVCWLIYTGISAADCVFKAVTIRRKSLVVFAVVYCILFANFAAIFIIALCTR